MRQAIERVLDSQRFVLGDEVRELENSIAEYCQTKHAIGCASGSDALLLALMALDIKEGDEIITTPFSFFATGAAIARLGAHQRYRGRQRRSRSQVGGLPGGGDGS